MKKRVLFLTLLLLAAMVFTSALLADSGPVLHLIEANNSGNGGCVATGTANGGSIPDNTPAGVCFPVSVTGPAGATINDVTIDVAATHSWVGDLAFTVQSPDATNLTIMNRPGEPVVGSFGENDDLSASSPISFTDSSANPAENMGDGTTASNQVICQDDGICDYSPDNPFSTLAGENALGTWNFCVSDNAGGDTGSISSFTVNVACTASEPPAPAIVLTKTVGTDINACATTDSITIPAGGGGTDVTYCYYMTNTGNVTFVNHLVVDDQLGTLLGPDFPAVVGPGSSAWFTVTTLITQTTVNSATWTASVPAPQEGGQSASSSDTATVTQGQPTDVSLSSFGSEQAALSPVWLATLFALMLGFGLVIRRKMTNN